MGHVYSDAPRKKRQSANSSVGCYDLIHLLTGCLDTETAGASIVTTAMQCNAMEWLACARFDHDGQPDAREDAGMSPERFSTRNHVHHHHFVQVIRNILCRDEVQKVILLDCESVQGVF